MVAKVAKSGEIRVRKSTVRRKPDVAPKVPGFYLRIQFPKEVVYDRLRIGRETIGRVMRAARYSARRSLGLGLGTFSVVKVNHELAVYSLGKVVLR